MFQISHFWSHIWVWMLWTLLLRPWHSPLGFIFKYFLNIKPKLISMSYHIVHISFIILNNSILHFSHQRGQRQLHDWSQHPFPQRARRNNHCRRPVQLYVPDALHPQWSGWCHKTHFSVSAGSTCPASSAHALVRTAWQRPYCPPITMHERTHPST